MDTKSYGISQSAKKWYSIDASNMIVGRLATKLSLVLQGKNKPTYVKNIDNGDFIVVTNAEKVVFTGKKETSKIYWRYTGYPGGERATLACDLRKISPEKLICYAVKGMLPKGPMGRKMLKKLKVYSGSLHPHEAQNPSPLLDKK